MTPADTDTPLGLDAVTEADIRRTLRGTAGSNAGAVRRRIREGAAKELARLETEAGRLRGWLSREERKG